MTPKITFVGGGNMARALIGGLISQGTKGSQIRVVVRTTATQEALHLNFGVATSVVIDSLVSDSDVVVLATKPQQIPKVAMRLRPFLGKQLVISIATGIRCADLARWLGDYPLVVRAMPNTPCMIRAGVTGLTAGENVPSEKRMLAEHLLQSVGSTIWVKNDQALDALTAISGCGPAYVFYFIEALQKAALDLGIEPENARKLSLETFLGAAKLAAQSPEAASTLRERVTSKGGVTALAIESMNAVQMSVHFGEAIKAAANRANTLGDEFSK